MIPISKSTQTKFDVFTNSTNISPTRRQKWLFFEDRENGEFASIMSPLILAMR